MAQEEKLGVEANAKHQAGEHDAASTARDKVLGINEILTNVLVHLPPKRIFEVQSVSKSFLNAIQKSPEIQEKLFLRQRRKIKNVPAERRSVEHAKLATNPLLLREGWQMCSIGIDNIPNVKIESSILDTYPLDVPCGEICLNVEVSDRKERRIVAESEILGTEKTMRELMASLLRKKSDLIVDHGQHCRREQCRGCSASELMRQW